MLDYGSGNLRSAERALARVGADVTVTADFDAALDADGLVVPGVGRVRGVHGRAARGRAGRVIGRRLAGGRPVLGICVGMQILFERGVEHGVRDRGLRGVAGHGGAAAGAGRAAHGLEHRQRAARAAVLFAGSSRRAVLLRALLRGAAVGAGGVRPVPAAGGDLGRARRDRFVAAVENGPLSATQFHPEKSGDAGAELLRQLAGPAGLIAQLRR